MRYLLPALGCALLLSGSYTLYRVRSWVALLAACSDIAGSIAFALWARENSLFLDQLTGRHGLGMLIFVVAVDLCIGLQFAFRVTLCDGWHRWYKVAAGVAVVLVALAVPLWARACAAVGGDVMRLLYSGYHGKPPAILVWNVFVGVTFIYLCALMEHVFWSTHLPPGIHTTIKRSMAAVYAAGLIYGLLIVVQAVLDDLGYGATSVLPLMSALWVLATVVAGGATVCMVGVPYAQRRHTLGRELNDLRRARHNLTQLHVLLSDRLVHLYAHTDPVVVATVDKHCRAYRLPPDQQLVALEAARWITVRRAILARRPWPEVNTEAAGAIDQTIVMDAAARLQQDAYMYADVYRVVILALGVEHVPIWLRPLRDLSPRQYLLGDLLGDTCASAAYGRRRTIQARSIVEQERTGGRRFTTRRGTAQSLALAHVARNIVEARRHLIGLSVACSDRLVYVRDHIDLDVVQAVTSCHDLHNLPPYHRRVALEATRWLGLFPRHTLRWSLISGGTPISWTPALDSAPSRVQELHFYADVYQVILPALEWHELPVGIKKPRGRTEWHRDLAALILTVLATTTGPPMRQEERETMAR